MFPIWGASRLFRLQLSSEHWQKVDDCKVVKQKIKPVNLHVLSSVSASKSLGDILARLTAKIEDSQFNGARCDLLLLDVDDGLLWSNVSLEVLSAGRTVVSASRESISLKGPGPK